MKNFLFCFVLLCLGANLATAQKNNLPNSSSNIMDLNRGMEKAMYDFHKKITEIENSRATTAVKHQRMLQAISEYISFTSGTTAGTIQDEGNDRYDRNNPSPNPSTEPRSKDRRSKTSPIKGDVSYKDPRGFEITERHDRNTIKEYLLLLKRMNKNADELSDRMVRQIGDSKDYNLSMAVTIYRKVGPNNIADPRKLVDYTYDKDDARFEAVRPGVRPGLSSWNYEGEKLFFIESDCVGDRYLCSYVSGVLKNAPKKFSYKKKENVNNWGK